MPSTQLVPVQATTTISRIAADNGVAVADVFVPYEVLSRNGQPVVISPAVRAALFHSATQQLLIGYQTVSKALAEVAPAVRVSETRAEVPVGSVGREFVLFVEPVTTTGRKAIPAGSVCMIYRTTDIANAPSAQQQPASLSQASYETSSLPPSSSSTASRTKVARATTQTKRTRSQSSSVKPTRQPKEDVQVVDAHSLASSIKAAGAAAQSSGSMEREWTQHFENAMRRALRDIRAGSAAPRANDKDEQTEESSQETPGAKLPAAKAQVKVANRILRATLRSVKELQGKLPLHNLPDKWVSGRVVMIGGIPWQQPDKRILCRVFRGSESASAAGSTPSLGASSRYVAAFLMDDLLGMSPIVRRFLNKDSSNEDDDQPAASANAKKSNDAHSDDEAYFDAETLQNMEKLSNRGYRIVFMAHCPYLHHGSATATKMILAPFTRFIRNRCKGITVTVLISAVSVISSVQEQRQHSMSGASGSFIPPNSGLWLFFIAQYNAALRADESASAMIGSDSEILSDTEKQFASNCGVRYLTRKEFRSNPMLA